MRVTCPLCQGWSPLQEDHNSGKITCPDGGLSWADNLSGGAGWEWFRQLLTPDSGSQPEAGRRVG